ncbi:MAG: HNH endonuclease [Candidatus Nitrotoga sp.]|nr:HNH endonuclease [Candidatus Nitrotoga sp.]
MEKSKRSRKQFILEQGATCDNWFWSWSFVNLRDKVIIFGAWDTNLQGGKCLILGKNWETRPDGRKSNGYPQSFRHIGLIKDKGYKLKTFPLIYSDANKDALGQGPAKIDGFIEDLQLKVLQELSDGWYACDDTKTLIAEEINLPEKYIEGASQKISVNAYERNAKARAACIACYGYKCFACDFDFEKTYGDLGKEYIHVHHVVPLHKIRKEYEINPEKHLRPLCPNCHAMVHRTSPALEIEELKKYLNR